MGKFQEIVHEQLLREYPDRKANILRITRKDDREVHIQFRNFRITLIDDEIREWRDGFTEALSKLGNHFHNDL